MEISAINNVKRELKFHDICKIELTQNTLFSELKEKNGFEKIFKFVFLKQYLSKN